VYWHLNSLASLHWRCWDRQWIVFDAGSGQTHSLDEITAATLSRIECEPTSTADLIALAARESNLGNVSAWSEALGSVLERLASVGLIELTAS